LLLSSQAHATDVADEADVEFGLGAERYEARDFAHALAHFLASNRLARNRNVLFNIARCYEQMRQFPEAHRYYSRAVEGETDAGARAAKLAAGAGALATPGPELETELTGATPECGRWPRRRFG